MRNPYQRFPVSISLWVSASRSPFRTDLQLSALCGADCSSTAPVDETTIRRSLAELEAFEWPAFSDREGDSIFRGTKALRDIVALLQRHAPPDSTSAPTKKSS
jgi:hypothetical protein